MKKTTKKLLLRFFCLCIAAMLSGGAWAQQIIKGTLRNAAGDPVSGATINVKGKNIKAVTNADGIFQINANSGEVLIITHVGFAEKEITITGAEINEVLVQLTASLDEVVVIGYQTVRKKDLTGAVSIVNVNSAQKNIATTVGESMQGLAAGVNVRTTGRAGGEAVVEIRGIGSLLNNTPFYVIDGLPSTVANRDLNPNDIESIQVLKDASAAAIYGARAANGVIIITTKKGKDGPLALNFSTRQGIQTVPKKFDLMDASEFAATNKLAYQNGGVTPMPSVSTAFNPNINNDLQNAILSKGGFQENDLSI